MNPFPVTTRLLGEGAVNDLAVALKAELGTHEERGPNDGTCIKYQRVTGNGKGDSWCLSFLMWGVLQIVGSIAALKEVFGIVTASCEELRQAARKRGQLMPVGTSPKRGDIGLVVNTQADHAHHAFFVNESQDSDGPVETIEGNSNNTGGSNGDGAYLRDSRFGWGDTAMKSGALNHYELVRVTG